MDTRRLRLLLELSRCGSMREVAEELHVTTSTVSQQLAVLAKEAGATLIEPDGRRVRLTPAGRRLAEHAVTILSAVEAARLDLDPDAEPAGTLRVAGFATAVRRSLLPLVAELAERHPRVRLLIHEHEPDEAFALLAADEIDLALTYGYNLAPATFDASVAAVPLWSTSWGLGMPSATAADLDAARPQFTDVHADRSLSMDVDVTRSRVPGRSATKSPSLSADLSVARSLLTDAGVTAPHAARLRHVLPPPGDRVAAGLSGADGPPPGDPSSPPAAAPTNQGHEVSPALFARFRNDDWIVNSRNMADERAVRAIAGMAGFEPRIAHRADNLNLVQDLIVAGLGVGLLPIEVPTIPGVHVVALRDPNVTMRAYAVTRRGRSAWPPLALLLGLLRSPAASPTVASTAGE